MTEYLDLEDLLGLVRALGVGPVRDVGLLDAAAARPRSTAFGTDAYPSLSVKAAALLHSLVRNHGLGDDKSLAWLATVVFLEVNDVPMRISDDGALTLVMEAAAGDLDVEAIAHRSGQPSRSSAHRLQAGDDTSRPRWSPRLRCLRGSGDHPPRDLLPEVAARPRRTRLCRTVGRLDHDPAAGPRSTLRPRTTGMVVGGTTATSRLG